MRKSPDEGTVANNPLKVFTGSANPSLTREICGCLSLTMGEASLGQFSDGETYFQVGENVRGVDVFVVQPTSQPGDHHLMELLLMIDAFKRASAARITAVMPYYGYARQDRKDKPRVPISAKVVADLVETAGANRALVMDLHAPQIQGYFNVPVDHIFATPVLLEYFLSKKLPDLTVVAPDAGGVERARFFAKNINDAPIAIVDKRRVDVNVAEVLHVIGEVEGRTALIIDDMVDTAGTLVKTVEALLKQGAKEVYAACTHPVLSGPALERIAGSNLKELVSTNSIPLNGEATKSGQIKILSVGPLLARAIHSIHEEASVSTLFI
jgi:ribose-phosphate pyrophosphokinase